MKKIIIVLLIVLFINSLVLTGCDSSLTRNNYNTTNSYCTTAEKFGINIPDTGIILDEWCLSEVGMTYAQILNAEYIPTLYKDEVLTQPFNGSDRLYANTPIFSEVNLMGDKTPIGKISGTITLTDVPNPAPRVYISVRGDISNYWSSFRGGWIIFNSDNYTNLSWTIPIYEDYDFSPSNGNFTLYVYTTDKDDNNSFFVDIPITPYISNVNTSGINLGTVSIKSIKLSGTINITHNGQSVQYANIWAVTTDRQFIGSTWLDYPTSNASWSMLVSANNSDITFQVSGRGYDDWYFRKDNLSLVSVYNQDTSGIVINVGDIRTITLSGTISVTYKGQQVPYVDISAWSQNEWLGCTNLPSPANSASWSITVEVPNSEKNIYFDVFGGTHESIYMGESFFFRKCLSPVSVYNQNKSGINLNLGNITSYEDYDGDIVYYSQSIQIDPNNADAYFIRGFAYYNKGDYDLAIADYTQALRINPNNSVTYNNRGAAYNNIGNYDLAIVDLDQSIQLNQNVANPYRHRAFAYMKKGNYLQARADVNKSLQIDPNYKSAQELSAELKQMGY